MQPMCDRSVPSDGDTVRPLILLLVDDEPLREALKFSLETDGYAVNAPDGVNACAACVECRAAACVVIDDGLSPLPSPTVGRPTIVLTGDPDRLVRRGVVGVTVVEKPLLDDALARELSHLVAKP
jgi:hypothetical protein